MIKMVFLITIACFILELVQMKCFLTHSVFYAVLEAAPQSDHSRKTMCTQMLQLYD